MDDGAPPEPWVDSPREALTSYQAAFATVLHRDGQGADIVGQLGLGTAAFWVAPASSTIGRLSPRAIEGATGRTLLVGDGCDRPASEWPRQRSLDNRRCRAGARLQGRSPDRRS